MDFKILECRKFFSQRPMSTIPRIVKDYEIDIEMGDERMVIIDDVQSIIKRGDVCVHKPGQRIWGRGLQNSILLTLDFSGEQDGQHYIRNIEGSIQQPFDHELIENLNGVIRPYSEYTFIPIYAELLQSAFESPSAAHQLVMELIYKLNAEVCRHNYTTLKPKETATGKVLRYMKDNLGQDITLEKLADLVHLEKNYLVRSFKKAYGQSPINALIAMRMEYACDLVANTDMPINDVATACGYTSPSYFTAEYKKHFGETPLKQRRKN